LPCCRASPAGEALGTRNPTHTLAPLFFKPVLGLLEILSPLCSLSSPLVRRHPFRPHLRWPQFIVSGKSLLYSLQLHLLLPFLDLSDPVVSSRPHCFPHACAHPAPALLPIRFPRRPRRCAAVALRCACRWRALALALWPRPCRGSRPMAGLDPAWVCGARLSVPSSGGFGWIQHFKEFLMCCDFVKCV
jgi:hypothetical protein